MEIFKPAYYDGFRCIAGDCPDSCCQEWAVDVDAEAAARYRALPGALGDRLRQVLVDTDDGTVMEIEKGRCPMWRDDGLCRVQAELGHEALCHTCRKFPRLTHEYEGFLEMDLELSCPEAARLILTGDDTLFSREISSDDAVMDILLRSREAALALLDGPGPVQERLQRLLLYGYEVQSALDGGQLPEGLPAPMVWDRPGDLESIFAFFQELEILTDRWRQLLEKGPRTGIWEPGIARIARYLVRRYWLQAVADFDLVGRVKLTVTACILLNALDGALLHTAQLFSKEIENDPDNMDAILDGAYEAPALTDSNLLGLLR